MQPNTYCMERTLRQSSLFIHAQGLSWKETGRKLVLTQNIKGIQLDEIQSMQNLQRAVKCLLAIEQ